MTHFNDILEKAIANHGSLEAITTRLPEPSSELELKRTSDTAWMEAFAFAVFAVQFSRKVLEKKWPAFQEAFHQFDPHRIALYSDEDFDRLMSNAAIIRNGAKIRATLENAIFLNELARSYGQASHFFADWPVDDITGLWTYMKKHGSRLGGATGPRVLRHMGKDTFILTPDVVTALIRENEVDKAPTTPKALAKVQAVFNQWALESGRPLCQISMILSYSVGPHSKL